MPSFSKYFIESKAKPVSYKGQVIHLADFWDVNDGQKLRVVFESANSDWRQGVYLSADVNFVIDGEVIPRATVLWYDTAPREVVIDIKARTRRKQRLDNCLVKNVWDRGDGFMDSGHNGAAMIVESLHNGRRYRCNDGFPDEDFDDVVFRVEPFE